MVNCNRDLARSKRMPSGFDPLCLSRALAGFNAFHQSFPK